jgi:hypothetical protein
MHRMTRWIVVAVLIALAAVAGFSVADYHQIPMVVIHSETQIARPPAAVWSYITSGKNFATWCPNWKAAKNSKINITRVGDVLDYADSWGNGGRSVVTYAVQGRELRVAHEPLKGDYVCQAKFVLTRAAGGTHLDFWDQYSDSSATNNLEATAQKMQSEADTSLAAIKQGAESPPPPAAAKRAK